MANLIGNRETRTRTRISYVLLWDKGVRDHGRPTFKHRGVRGKSTQSELGGTLETAELSGEEERGGERASRLQWRRLYVSAAARQPRLR